MNINCLLHTTIEFRPKQKSEHTMFKVKKKHIDHSQQQ